MTDSHKDTEPTEPSTGDYGASSIQVLEGLEAVRKRPGMYIGSTGPRGLHHLVWEVVDNSVDEALAGYCDTITITIHKDNSVTVQDNGRGIPVDHMPQYDMPALEVVMTKLHAGGKFSKSSYKVSGGLHGVGISVVNALSTNLLVTVVREGSAHSMRFSRGTKIEGITTSDTVEFERGTRVTFTPDSEIFETIIYDYDVLVTRLRELAFLNSGLAIEVLDERTGESDSFRYEGGIAEFVSYVSEGKQPLHEPIATSTHEDDVSVDVAVQYNVGFAETVFSFVNNINTIEGGTHLTGFRSALTRAINQYLTKYMPKEAKGASLSGSDVREGLAAIVAVKVPEPQFEGQTKTKLGNSEVQGIVNSAVFAGLVTYFDENPSIARMIVEKCLSSARARQAAQKARELVRRKSVLESSSLPGKLADCSTRQRDRAELYIVEGDSAGGCFSGDTKVSLVDGRELSFTELVAEYEKGARHHCYTVLDDGSIGIGRIEHPRVTKRDAKVITLTLDNGRTITCTPDHKFMLRDGSYRRADEITSEDSLMPLYRQVSRKGRFITIEGYEMVFDPKSERWLFTHVLADEANIRAGVYDTSGSHRHHVDFDKRNNDPRNIVRLEAHEHLEIHRKHAYRTLHMSRVREKLAKIKRTPSYRRKVSESLKRRAKELSARAKDQWSDEEYKSFMKDAWKRYYDENESYRKEVKTRLDEAQRAYWGVEAHRIAQSDRVKQYFKDHPEARERLSARAREQWSDVRLRAWRSEKTRTQWTDAFREKRRRAYDETYRSFSFDLLRTIFEISGEITEETYERMRRRIGHPNILRYDTFIDRFYGSEEEMRVAVECYNHKVVGIEDSGITDVYDLEVPGTHNFALSAGVFVHNSAKQARSRDFQAILPLRGKILNVEKSHLSKAIKNKEIQALITAIGTSIGDDFDLEKLRYGKIVIMTDADVDGAHIRTLLLTFFFRFMPQLIENGKIYIAQPPLYKMTKGRSSTWLFSDRQLVAFQKEHEGYQIQRYKGLGEMNPNQLWETTMDPDARKMLQVTVEDAIYADKLFTILMGTEVEPRREFIEKHALEVENLDL